MKHKAVQEAVVFFVVTLAVTCGMLWGPIALFRVETVNFVEGPTGPTWAILMFIFGGFVPSIVGIVLTGVYEGKSGVRALLRQAVKVQFALKWYLLIIALSLYLGLSLIAISTLLGKPFDFSQFLVQLPTFLPLIVLGPISEELGWRGFATKRLLKTLHPNIAGLIVGIVWSLWHLPLFFIVGAMQYEFDLPFVVFLITTTSSSFAYTYFYIKTGGSIFSAIVFHWVYTYMIQVVNTTVERTELYNRLEFVPALLLGMVFVVLLQRQELQTPFEEYHRGTSIKYSGKQ